MGQLIIFGCYWNDMDWLEASLKQIEYWKPDKLYLCEGCWDPNYPARSTDGTREYLEEYAKGKENVYIVDNIRDGDYRENQANQCRVVTQLSDAKPGDWMMYMACDFYMLKAHIDKYKKMMEDGFDYPIFEIWNFWDSTNLYFSKWAEMAVNLPWRLVDEFEWVPICHLAKNGKHYNECNDVVGNIMKIKGFHYEGFRKKDRLKEKYAVGSNSDRESPITWKDGIKLKKRDRYDGVHPEFAIPVLKKKGYLK